jgi:hypothetical protein
MTASKDLAVTEMKTTEKSENDTTKCDNLDKKSRTAKKHVTFRQTVETSDQCKVKKVYNPNFSGPLVSIIKKESLKYPILVYKTNCIVRPSKLTEIVKNSANNIDKLNSLKFGREYASSHQSCAISVDNKSPTSSNVIVASKFNLPKLSVNSSRVIKPNKRFLFDTGEDPSTQKKKVIKPSPWGAGAEPASTATLLKEKKNFGKSNECFYEKFNSNKTSSFQGFNFVDELDLKSNNKKHKAQTATSTITSVKSDESNKLSASILRKPVLQLSTSFGLFGSPQERDANAIKSPFSLQLLSPNSTNISSAIFTQSLVCHVCNSITTRKQPRKYGAICCELCKKFMSKIIERVNKNPVQNWTCDKGDGKIDIIFFFSQIKNLFLIFCIFFVSLIFF